MFCLPPLVLLGEASGYKGIAYIMSIVYYGDMNDFSKLPIDEDVPVPPRHRYPFEQMNVGDSLAIPADEYPRARMGALNYSQRRTVRFTSRKQPDGTGRIWRVA